MVSFSIAFPLVVKMWKKIQVLNWKYQYDRVKLEMV